MRMNTIQLSLAVAVLAALSNAADTLWTMSENPGGRGCQLGSPGFGSGMHNIQIQVGGQIRSFFLFVPMMIMPREEYPLWVTAPGAYETPARFLHGTGMQRLGEANKFLFVVLQSADIEGLNVGLHSRPNPGQPDDVEYTKATLRYVSQRMCINMRRLRCTGYSRGARFCSQLASELSNFIGGIAPVAGIRYPQPNNATRPIPIIAIHGTADKINPYWGEGDPSYWISSVPDAIKAWAVFNGCRLSRWRRKTKHVVLFENTACKDGASVVLVMIKGDGHTWPGSDAYGAEPFGHTTFEVDANELMRDFFVHHPTNASCHTAVQGEKCYTAVKEAMKKGLASIPEWAQRRPMISSFEDYQYELHMGIHADCARPCPEAPNSARPMATVPSAESVKVIEGKWQHEGIPGVKITEIIKDGQILWSVGAKTEIQAVGNGWFTAKWNGDKYHAQLLHGDLIWSDGDVWTRAQRRETRLIVKKTKEISASLWRRAQNHRAAQLLLIAGASMMLGAIVPLTSRAWRRFRLARFQGHAQCQYCEERRLLMASSA